MGFFFKGILELVYFAWFPLALSSDLEILPSSLLSHNSNNPNGNQTHQPLTVRKGDLYQYHYFPPCSNPKRHGFSQILWSSSLFPLKGLTMGFNYVKVQQSYEKIDVVPEEKFPKSTTPDSAIFEIVKKTKASIADRSQLLTFLESLEPTEEDLRTVKENEKHKIHVRIKRPTGSNHPIFLGSKLGNYMLNFPSREKVEQSVSLKSRNTGNSFSKDSSTKSLSKSFKAKSRNHNNCKNEKASNEFDTIILTVHPGEHLLYVPKEFSSDTDFGEIAKKYTTYFLQSSHPSKDDELINLPVYSLGIHINSAYPESRDTDKNPNTMFWIQRWFSQKFSYQVTLFPRYYSIPNSSSKYSFGISNFYDGERPFLFGFHCVLYSVSLSGNMVEIKDTSAVLSSPSSYPRTMVRWLDDKVRVTCSKYVPFSIYVIRDEITIFKIQASPWTFNKIQVDVGIEVKDNDVIAMVSEPAFNEKGPMIPMFISSFEPNIAKFIQEFENVGPVVVIKIKKKNNTILSEMTQKIYSIPALPSPGEDLGIVEATWITSHSKAPLSLKSFDQNIVYFGDMFEKLAFDSFQGENNQQYLGEIFSQSAKMGEIGESHSGMGLVMHGNQLQILHRIVEDTTFSIFLNRKGKRYLMNHLKMTEENSFSTAQVITIPVDTGDRVEVYRNASNVMQQNLDKLVDMESPVVVFAEIASYLPKSHGVALMLTIGEKSKDLSKVSEITCLRNNLIKCQDWFDLRSSKPGTLSPRENNNNGVMTIFHKQNSFKLQWSNEKLLPDLTVKYENYGMRIGMDGILISSNLRSSLTSVLEDAISSDEYMKAEFINYSLSVEIKGLVPFTLALYRGGTLVISWSQQGNYQFDDFLPGDFLIPIPWTAFQFMEMPEHLFPKSNDTLKKLLEGFSNGISLKAAILESN